ncbi:MAG: DUF2141 domain-containing protein [Synechococcales cyanobacterium CRU_2_2]|nr:DUF2141 domain-containing protein [Synechococcales cyanobacterium CRU_2_2]
MPETTTTALCSVTVTVTNLRSSAGQICFSLFAGPEGFPGDGERAIAKGFTRANGDGLAYTFPNLKPGEYAIALFHDENNNGILDKGFLGIPQEGFGFSQNPTILMGAPSFRATAITLERPQTEIQILLKYF